MLSLLAHDQQAIYFYFVLIHVLDTSMSYGSGISKLNEGTRKTLTFLKIHAYTLFFWYLLKGWPTVTTQCVYSVNFCIGLVPPAAHKFDAKLYRDLSVLTNFLARGKSM